MKLCLTCKVLIEDHYLNRSLIRDNLFFFFFLVAQMVKNLPAMQETRRWTLGQEYPLEKGMATHSSVLAWRIPWTEEPGRVQSMGLQRVGHDWATNTFTFFCLNSFTFFFPFIFISWRLITLQYCSGFCHTVTWISHGFTCIPHPDPPLPPPSLPDPSGSSQCTSPEHLSHASSLGWWAVSPLIIYMFRCCSLETSHPRLLPQSPKVCSIYLCVLGDVAEDSLSSLLLFTSGIILTDS